MNNIPNLFKTHMAFYILKSKQSKRKDTILSKYSKRQHWCQFIANIFVETEAVASSCLQCCSREAPLAKAWGQDSLIILCNAWNVRLMPVQKDKACKSPQPLNQRITLFV